MARERLKVTHYMPENPKRKNKGGRPKGTTGIPRSQTTALRTARELRDWAARSGELPHMFLLRISRGELIDGYKPTFHDRVDAAKFSAPYFAPKLNSVAVTGEDGGPVRTQTLVIDPARLQEFSEDELDVLERAVSRLQRGPDGDTHSKAAEDLEALYQATLDDE